MTCGKVSNDCFDEGSVSPNSPPHAPVSGSSVSVILRVGEAEREIGTGEMFWAVQCSEGHGAVRRRECGSLLSGQEQGNVIIILSRV